MGARTSLGSVVVAAAAIGLMGCTSLNGNDGWEANGDSYYDDGEIINVPTDVPPPKGMSCAYPQGAAFGVNVGQVIPVATGWTGLPPNEGERQFQLAEYFDCDGMKGVDAILISTSQYG